MLKRVTPAVGRTALRADPFNSCLNALRPYGGRVMHVAMRWTLRWLLLGAIVIIALRGGICYSQDLPTKRKVPPEDKQILRLMAARDYDQAILKCQELIAR